MSFFMRVSQKLVFHQSKCICAIKRILSTTAMYVSSSSFMYLRFPCYCDACLNSSDLRVGLKTLLNTIHLTNNDKTQNLPVEAKPDMCTLWCLRSGLQRCKICQQQYANCVIAASVNVGWLRCSTSGVRPGVPNLFLTMYPFSISAGEHVSLQHFNRYVCTPSAFRQMHMYL